jgi:hypothetical protein
MSLVRDTGPPGSADASASPGVIDFLRSPGARLAALWRREGFGGLGTRLSVKRTGGPIPGS